MTRVQSLKLVPVMAVSACWLGRRYSVNTVFAAFAMVISAAFFGLGERDLAPDGNHAAGFILSFACLGVVAIQSNIADKALRDFNASVTETMLYTNGIAAAFMVVVWVVLEANASMAYFMQRPNVAALVLIRSVLFWFGAWCVYVR